MWPYPKIIAHRGGGRLAPENTIAALRCGLTYGFHAAEFDVMLASDGIPVLMHDDRLGRTVAGKGRISDFTAQQLRQMDAGSWFGSGYAGEPVATYEEAFRFCRAHGVWMNVEIKPVPGFEHQTGHVVAQMTAQLLKAERDADLSAASLPLFSSFSFEALQAARAAAPGIPRGWLVEAIPADWLPRLRALDALALHVNHANLHPDMARTVKAAGFGLFCYTVNHPERARHLFSWGVDAFCTDRLDVIGADFC